MVGSSYEITLVWGDPNLIFLAPPHCSIYGNEKANSLAKVGAPQEGENYEFFHFVRQSTYSSKFTFKFQIICEMAEWDGRYISLMSRPMSKCAC